MNELQNKLECHVRMLAETFRPRDYLHPENLKRAADYVLDKMAQAGARDAQLQPFEVERGTYYNVSAFLGPETKERVVVGAHYDAVSSSPGADDNASAVAGLIELVGLLAADNTLQTAVELVAYCLEEPPFHVAGSAAHVKGLRDNKIPVKVMICLESIGYFTDEPMSQHFPMPVLHYAYPDEGNFIIVVGQETPQEKELVRTVKKAMAGASPLEVCSINAPLNFPGVSLSDHRSYWNEGVPAVMITDTAFYRNPNYHVPSDTPNTLDYRRLAQAVTGIGAAVRVLAASTKEKSNQ